VIAIAIEIEIAPFCAMVAKLLAGDEKRSRIMIVDAASSEFLWRKWKMPMLNHSMSLTKCDAMRRRPKIL
jgi:hypothetical protein